MGKVAFEIARTPNPNALRVGLSVPVSGTNLFFRSPSQAAAHPLAEKLFAIAGVASVFMMNSFITVNKQPDAEWEALQPQVTQVLEKHFNG